MSTRQCLCCDNVGEVALGIRARYANTNAAWAPNLDAYLCEEHAHSGCTIEITYTPATDTRVRASTDGPARSASIVLEIGTGRKEPPGQMGLI